MNWSRNGNPQVITFLIESSNNCETGWHIIGTTTKKTYEAQFFGPLGHNFFRCRVQKGDLLSEVCNIRVV